MPEENQQSQTIVISPLTPHSFDINHGNWRETGDLRVAVYSRHAFVEAFSRRYQEDPADNEAFAGMNVHQAHIAQGNLFFVSEEDYFYDVLDNVNKPARYSDREDGIVIGTRIMTWNEFKRLSDRPFVQQCATFQHFRYWCETMRITHGLAPSEPSLIPSYQETFIEMPDLVPESDEMDETL